MRRFLIGPCLNRFLQDKSEGVILKDKWILKGYLGERFMTKNDWYETGDQIRKLVQDAVDSKDFTQLGDMLTDVVNQTLDGLQSALKENLGSGRGENWDQDAREGADGKYQSASRTKTDWYQKTNRESAERIRRNMQERNKRRQEYRSGQNSAGSDQSKDRMYRPVKAKLKVKGELTGTIMKWSGYSMGAMFGLSIGILGVIAVSTGFSVAIPAGILGILCGTSCLLGAGGSRRQGIARRFRKYQEILGERTFCLVEELASGIGQSCKYVQKDLKKMIQKGYFSEGYLDRKETLLITDKSTYQQYLTTQAEYERREMMQKKEAADKNVYGNSGQNGSGSSKEEQIKKNNNLTPQCQELIEEGQRYIRHVHECNEKIPDEEMSRKLDRLELVITRIFREAEKNPDVVSDLRKMMSYYLPTTRKLLDAYCELDEQPIRGQNIENTKKEIEVALDTINEAFEKLLDGLFEETAWDISSDISVLHTMLKQEGLTGNDFGRE